MSRSTSLRLALALALPLSLANGCSATQTVASVVVRSSFYIGDYAGVLKHARNLKSLRGVKAKERDSFVARAYIAQKKFAEAHSLVTGSSATALLSVQQLLALRQSQSREERELIVDKVVGYAADDSEIVNSVPFLVSAAQLLTDCGKHKSALRLLLSATHADDSLELLLMQVQTYLSVNRVDLATRRVALMQDVDDDDPITTLATVCVALQPLAKDKGKAKANRRDVLRDILDKLDDLTAGFRQTSLLLNLAAVTFMQMGDFKNAWKRLQKAKELSSKQSTAVLPSATLINGIVCLQHLAKGLSTLPKLAGDLAKSDPNSSFLQGTAEMGVLFDKCADSFKSHVKTL